MNKLFSLMLALLFCFAAAGCDEDSTTKTTQIQPEPEKRVIFDLPEGWEWAGGSHESGDAIKWFDRDNPKGFYKIGDFSYQEGTQALAETNALEGFNSALDGRSCDAIPCTWTNEDLDYDNNAKMEFKTIEDTTFVVATNYWNQDNDEFWSSGINFAKDGIVYSGSIYGAPFDNFEQELKSILDSIRVE
mgnify:FL=1